MEPAIDLSKNRFPFCIVWTPTPVLSWIIPIIGHIGIATSNGIIRDFSYPYHVGTDKMAFGGPTKYWQLTKDKAYNGDAGWDAAVTEASHIYRKRMNYLVVENCHSHVSKALNLMQYDGNSTWRSFKLAYLMLRHGKYVRWIIPIIGHIGIATSNGIIRDFSYPYHVGTDKMAFGGPTKYWQLTKDKAYNGDAGWDAAVTEASHIYRKRMNYLVVENCHSHVSKALNLMQYDGNSTWRSFKLAYLMLRHGKYVSRAGFLKTWLPFSTVLIIVIIVVLIEKLS